MLLGSVVVCNIVVDSVVVCAVVVGSVVVCDIVIQNTTHYVLDTNIR